MSYSTVPLFITVCCLLSTVLSDQVRWLIEGNFIASDAIPIGVKINTQKLSYNTSGIVTINYAAENGNTITGVVAAAVYMKGWVSIFEGGVGSQRVKLGYTTENGEPDVFHIAIQSVGGEPILVKKNTVETTRYQIVYDAIANWTQEEIQDALKRTNFTLV